jgi:hypothetical protein
MLIGEVVNVLIDDAVIVGMIDMARTRAIAPPALSRRSLGDR